MKKSRHNFWTKKENVINEAKKYNSKKDFYTNSASAYYAALKLGILNEFTWFTKKQDLTKLQDCIYAYIFEDLKYAYIGRTLLERIKQRDEEHFSKNKNEPTYKFIKENKIERVPLKIIESGITVSEGIEREIYWANYYKENGYSLINTVKCGGVGALEYRIWDDKNVEIESKKYKTRGEFAKCSPSAYKYALKKRLLKKFIWLTTKMKKPIGYWDLKHNVFIESKKYVSRTDFYNKCSSAYRSAIKHGWIDEMTWLKNERKVKRNYWTIDNLKKEANKFKTKAELLKNNKSAYITAKKKGVMNLLYNE